MRRLRVLRTVIKSLAYLLADHLGSTVEALDALHGESSTAGNTIAGSEIKYWPYGATRTGGVPQTDKLYGLGVRC